MTFNNDGDDFGFEWPDQSNNDGFQYSMNALQNDVMSFDQDFNFQNHPSFDPFLDDETILQQKNRNVQRKEKSQSLVTKQNNYQKLLSSLSIINLLKLHNQAQLMNKSLSKITRKSNVRQKSLPLPQIEKIEMNKSNEFNEICLDADIKFNPKKLGFIPNSFWPNKDFTFGELVSDFFQRKNNANSRFYHKLYNALKITEDDQFYVEYVGIEWVSSNVLKVDKYTFARLLGIKTIDGSLFHQQGNFPSHGFIELSSQDALKYVSKEVLEGVDFDKIRLLIHQDGIFVRGCSEDKIENCKWKSTKKRLN